MTEIFARYFLNVSMQSVDEIGGYVVAVTGTVGMALATWYRAHTRIDILLNRLPVVIRAVLNVFAYAMLSCGAIFMAFMAWNTLSESIAFNSVTSTPLQTPLWIPQAMWFAGLVAFSMTSLVMTAKGVLCLRSGWSATDEYLAPATLRQAIEEQKPGASRIDRSQAGYDT